MVVLDRLAPAELLAFVLHDLSAVPFDEIAPVVGRSPSTTRQLASRARRRVVEAFLAATRGGDFEALLSILDPDGVVRIDPIADDLAARARRGPSAAGRGADVTARTFAGWARSARPALVGGKPGAVWAPGGRVRSAFCFEVPDGRVMSIEIVADPDRIADLEPSL